MKKTLITLLALSSVSMGGTIDLIATSTGSTFTDGNPTDDSYSATGITAANVAAYDLNEWHCTYAAADADNQSAVHADKIVLQLGNVVGEGKGNYAAVKFNAETPSKLTFDIDYHDAWGNNESSGLTAVYSANVYGFDAEGNATNIGSWSTTIVRSSVKTYEGESPSITLDTTTEYASYGVIFDVTKTASAAGGFAMNISNIVVTDASVPEPTTATLSLLALAGLAARRRRK